METFLWGLVKSVPTPAECSPPPHTPCSDAGPCSPSPATSTFKANFTFIVHVAHWSRHGWLAHAPAAHCCPALGLPNMSGGQSFRKQCNVSLATTNQQQGPGASSRPSPENLDGQG